MQHADTKTTWSECAQLLKQWAGLREKTEQFIENTNNTVLYVVDTDIIKAYTAPYMLGSGEGNTEVAYGVLFPPDKENSDAAGAITEIIAKYIFFELQSEFPALQLPQHARETARVYQAVERIANIEMKGLRTLQDAVETLKIQIGKKIEDSFQRINVEVNTNTNELIKKTIDLLKETLAAVKQKSADAEYNQYLKLLTRGALITFDDVAEFAREDEYYRFLSEIIDPKEVDLGEWVELYDLQIKWIKRFRHQYQNGLSKTSEDDAYALAKLEMINKKLEPNIRIILITGANKIHKIAKEHDEDFYNKYIRHFHTFVVDAFHKTEQNIRLNQNNLYELWGEDTKTIKDFLGFNFIEGDTEISDTMKSELENDWNHYRDTLLRYAIGTRKDNVKLLAQKIRDIEADAFPENREKVSTTYLRKIREDINKVVKEIGEETIRARLEFVSEMSEAGINLLVLGKREKARNPPLLHFSTYPETNEVFRTLLQERNFTSDTFYLLIDKVKNECRESKEGTEVEIGINDFGYMYFLITGAIYAALNEWKKTVNLCEYAVQIARQEPKTREGKVVSGREAYFLLSSALRLTIKSKKDFDEAEKALMFAKKALEKDKKINPETHYNQYRFEAEEFAIRIGQFHFQNYKGDKANIDITEDDLNKVESLFATSCKDNVANEMIKNQNAINALQAVSIYLQVKHIDSNVFLSSNNGEFYKRITAYLDTERDLENNIGPHLVKTFLMESYYLFAKLLLRHNGINQSKVKKHFQKIATSTIYDEDKYKKLEKQCIEIIKNN